MTTDKQQPQDVVAVMRSVEALRQLLLMIFVVDHELLLGGQLGLLGSTPDLVEREVSADKDQPRGRVAWRTFDWPGFQRSQARFLKSVFSRVEDAEITQQRAEDLGTRGSQRPRDPSHVRHLDGPASECPAGRPPSAGVPSGLNVATGRISSVPWDRSRPSNLAAAIASSRVGQ